MEGRVKWFSKDKGYGFITGLDNIDRYFNESSVEGGETPNNGDVVSFDEKQGLKGPQAIDVKILGRHQPQVDDDRVACGSCGRKMVPQVVLEVNWRGRKQPYHSVCPYCGAKYKEFETGCFIASALYGGYESSEVRGLRRFRDELLLPSACGRAFVTFYYRFSPAVAVWLERNPNAKQWARRCLNPMLSQLASRFKAP
jgi:cold shock CspA family protein